MITEKRGILRSALCIALALILALTMFVIPASANTLSLNHSSIALTKGYATTLSVSGAGSSAVTWSSSDSTIASVSSAGKVVGRSVGSAYIYAEVSGVKLKCLVKVVGGKLTASTTSVSLDENEATYVTITAKGSHGMKVEPADRTVVKASWVTPWDGDNIRLKLTGLKKGTTTVKVYLTKYTDVYTTIKVTVKGDDAILLTSASSVTATVGGTGSVMVYSDVDNACTFTVADKSVATVSTGSWKNHYCTATITGVKAGTTTLTITRTDDTSVKKTVSITVSGSGYYAVSSTIPAKTAATDSVIRWTDSKTGTLKYMLVPYGYDSATVNTAVAKDAGKYDYYTVFDTTPTKQLSTDVVQSFTATVSGKQVTRYILTPVSADTPSVNTAKASYTGIYDYWTLYNVQPTKLTYNDVIQSWTATSNYQAVTRYVLLPYGYSESMLESLKSSDASSSNNGYYSVSLTAPTTVASGDAVLRFNAIVNNSPTVCYVLVPANYDAAKYNDAVAGFTGTYSRWTIYTVQPTKVASTDVVKSWTKVVDGKQTTRYVLLPEGYNEAMYNSLVSEDLKNSSSAYYAASSTYPTSLSATDTVYMYSNSTGAIRYMLLPENPSIVKRNDAVLKDTGVYDYYAPYSTQPTAKKASTDIVLKTYDSVTSTTVYMLVPADYTTEKVTAGMSGVKVTV